MAIYSISDLEKLSGIKTHTIRVWEQRYGIIRPQRTATNIRYYEDDDLQLLLNIALLNRHGFKISKIATLNRQEISQRVSTVSDGKMGLDAELDVLTLSVIEMDEYKLTRIFNYYVDQLGFTRAILEVVYPFLEKLSLLWLTGSIKPVQENFITQIIRNKLIHAIEKEPLTGDRKAPKFLLYLPKGEQQELSLLFMHYLLKTRKLQVINIGYDTGLLDMKDVLSIHQPDYIFTVLSETFSKEPVQRYIDNLSELAGNAKLLLTGYLVTANHVKTPANATILSNLQETIELLDAICEKQKEPGHAAG